MLNYVVLEAGIQAAIFAALSFLCGALSLWLDWTGIWIIAVLEGVGGVIWGAQCLFVWSLINVENTLLRDYNVNVQASIIFKL